MARLMCIASYCIEAQSTEDWFCVLRELDKHKIPFWEGPTVPVPRYKINIPAEYLEKASAALVLADIHLERVEPKREVQQ